MKERLEKKFEAIFGAGGDIRTYFAPGRVNLIGEHTDYNGGHVFPCALTIGTYAAARKNSDGRLRFYSMNFEQLGVIEANVRDLTYRKEDDWANYPKGVIWAAMQKGYEVPYGMDILFEGTIPNSSGLSSSASIEVLTGYVLKDLFNLSYDMIENAQIGQYAENQFIGVNCGIMDQFAIAMGKENHAIFLDTATLAYEYVPVRLDGCRIVIMNTNKKRGLGDSKYNERRAECEEALAELKTRVDIASLGDLNEEQFAAYEDAIASPIRRKRARHAVLENQRTIRAVGALQAGDIAEFGRLMTASHVSLRDDYEVTGKELDTLVSEALSQPGVLGARMTGAGFGGCAVSLVQEEKVENLISHVGEKYTKEIGYAPTFYVVAIGSGPKRL